MSEDHILSQTARCSNVPGNDEAPLLLEGVHADLEQSKLSIRAPPMQKLAYQSGAFSGLKEQLTAERTHTQQCLKTDKRRQLRCAWDLPEPMKSSDATHSHARVNSLKFEDKKCET